MRSRQRRHARAQAAAVWSTPAQQRGGARNSALRAWRRLHQGNSQRQRGALLHGRRKIFIDLRSTKIRKLGLCFVEGLQDIACTKPLPRDRRPEGVDAQNLISGLGNTAASQFRNSNPCASRRSWSLGSMRRTGFEIPFFPLHGVASSTFSSRHKRRKSRRLRASW